MLLHLIIFYVALFFLTAVLFLKAIFSRHSKLPPSPLALPVIGHLHLLGPLKHQSFHKLSSRLGPLISLRIGSRLCVVASTPELAEKLLKANEHTFSDRRDTSAIYHLTYNSSFVFAPYGPYWKFIKKISTIQLLGTRTLGQFLPIRKQELNFFVKFLLDKSKAGESVNITQELLKLTNNVISQMMFSMRCSGTDGQAEEARRLVQEATEIFGEFNISDVIWFFKYVDFQGFKKRFMDIHRRYDSLLEKIITNREQVRKENNKKGRRTSDVGEDEEARDFLDIMLDVLENEKPEMKLTRDHIKALVLDFLTTGTESTAMAVEWALVELINNPIVLEKAQKEIDQVVGTTRLVEESDCPNLLYLQAIVKETLRLHPPLPMITRKSTEDSKIDKYIIPKGTLLFVNIWSIGRDPNIWKNPLNFQPERFLNSNKGDGSGINIDVRGLHYQLLPFGTGRRGCPGINLAMQELPTTLAAMIQCFNWKVVHPEGGEFKGGDNVVDVSERAGLTTPRTRDLVCVPLARCTPI